MRGTIYEWGGEGKGSVSEASGGRVSLVGVTDGAVRVRIHSDENDMTYFIHYILESFEKAIVQFREYLERKQREAATISDLLKHVSDLNERQVGLLEYFFAHADETIDVVTYYRSRGISRVTGYNDLTHLVTKGCLTRIRRGSDLYTCLTLL